MQETDSNQWDIFTENEYVYKTETQGSYIRTKTREILTNNYEKPKVENTQKKWHLRHKQKIKHQNVELFFSRFCPDLFFVLEYERKQNKTKKNWENSSFRVRKKNYHNIYRRTILAGSKQNEKRAVNEKL